MTQYIKAPFNFVPLNEKVFFPDWADQVSHDIPFSDGESGEIELELEAMTPVFVRNGHTKEDAEAKNDDYVSFSKGSDGNYFIPGTSIKGMIRNVLEIMSFGKMNRISNDRYGFRDLQNTPQYLSLFQNKDLPVRCGYLRKISDSQIQITDHGIPFRISHQELDNNLGSNLCEFCKSKSNLKKDQERTSQKKYNLFKNITLDVSFRQDDSLKTFKKDPRIIVRIAKDGNLKGRVVLTGQPGVREKKFNYKKGKDSWSGKFYEFIFPFDEKAQPEKIPINDEKDLRFKDFLFVHKDSTDWKDFRKKQFDNREAIPVFFIKDESGKILHFGLSYLYKIPYKKRVKDCLYDDHKKNIPDFADLIFGNQSMGLKGRVQFSNAKLISGGIDKKMEPLMGSPKASYYPIYLKQKSTNGFLKDRFYQTYSSVNPILKGWKRYPVHDNEIRTFEIDDKQKKNASPFIPIKKESKFSLKIRYHNLKPEEVGALLIALNIKNSKGFHSIGFAKPYGYGKIMLTIKPCHILEKFTEYTFLFKKTIENEIREWEKSKQISEFIQMSKSNGMDEKLSYMSLPEFAAAKSGRKNFENKLILPYFSEFGNEKMAFSKNYSNKPFKNIPGVSSKVLEKKSVEKKEMIVHPKVEVQPDWKKGIVVGFKKIKLEEENIEIAMVIPKEKSNITLKIGDKVWVKIKQLKKDGTINQVEFITKA